MHYEWDEAKRVANLAKHGVDFDEVHGFEWASAVLARDARKDYGEPRFVALGRVGARLCVLVFAVRGEVVRIISLRKANPREVKRYEAQTQHHQPGGLG